MIKEKTDKPERKGSSSHGRHQSSQAIVVDNKSPLTQGESIIQSVHGKGSAIDG